MRALLFSLILTLPLAAQADETLSLRQAEDLWRQHSRELRLARVALAGAEADLRTAGQTPNPEVSLNLLSLNVKGDAGKGAGLSDKKADTILRVDQLVERGGKRELRLRGAEARRDAARLDVDDTGRLQLGQLRAAYYGLLLAQQKLALARETAALYARSSEAGRLREKVGDIAPVDVARLLIDQARAESDARQAQAELEQAQQVLAYLTGREAVASQLVAGDAWPALDDATLGAGVLAARPDLLAAERRRAAAEAERDLARALKTRDVTVGMQYEHNMQNLPNDSIGFGLSVPLFVNHAYEGEIARAEADFDAAREQYEMLAAQAGVQLAQARSALLAARDRCRRLESGLLADAERVAQAAELAYAKGAMGLLDLLDARRTLRQIQFDAATARADYARALSDWQLQAEYGNRP